MKLPIYIILVLALFDARMLIAGNSAKFSGVGSPGFLTIEGTGGVPKGELKVKGGKSSGAFDVDLNDFTTGIDMRDMHMKEKYLETAKYPKARLVLDPVVIPKDGYFNWKGHLSLHGVTKAVEGVSFVDNKKIESKFEINTLDFNITKATYLGVGLNEKISLVVTLDLPPAP